MRAEGAAGSLNVGTGALLAFSCVNLWKGLVDTSLALLAGGAGVETLLSWLLKAIFFKNGFFVSVSPKPGWGLVNDEAGGLATEDGGVFWCTGIGGAGGGAAVSRGNS